MNNHAIADNRITGAPGHIGPGFGRAAEMPEFVARLHLRDERLPSLLNPFLKPLALIKDFLLVLVGNLEGRHRLQAYGPGVGGLAPLREPFKLHEGRIPETLAPPEATSFVTLRPFAGQILL